VIKDTVINYYSLPAGQNCQMAQGKMRYTDLKNKIPDISQKMLTCTLRKLEKDHLLKRKAYAEIPPRVEYSLTDLGKSLIPIIEKMIEWGQKHFIEVTK
jgi:DNA-binding HxlR family transcriptional regulator